MYGNNRRDILYGYRYGYSIIPCSIDIMGIYGNILYGYRSKLGTPVVRL